MAEAAAGKCEGQQRVNGGAAGFYKSLIAVPIDAQSRQGRDHLGNGLAGGGEPGAAAIGAEGAVRILHLAEPGQGHVHRLSHPAIAFHVGCQGLEGHAGHVRVRPVAGDGPAAVRGLGRQYGIHQRRPGGRGPFGHRVIAAVQSQQGPDGAIIALVADKVQVPQPLQQFALFYLSHVLAQGGKGQNHPGILRGFGLVEPSVLVHGPFDILQGRLIVVLRSGHPSSGPSQAKDHPLAADRADSGCAQLFHIVPGGFVNL